MMKKIVCLTLTLAAAFSLFACGDDSGVACEHIDADVNGVCDECGAEVCIHVDEDKDMICDWCEVAIDCLNHEDKEPDGKCDYCGAEVEVTVCVDKDKNGYCDFHNEFIACDACVDKDVNGKCDVCGAVVSRGEGAAFFDAVKNSEPTSISTMTTLKYSDDEVYNGIYTTEITADGFVFTWNYKAPVVIVPGEESDEPIEALSGKVICKDGLYSTDDGKTWVSEAPSVAYLNMVFNLNEDSLGEYNITAGGKTLSATLTKAQLKNIFGIDINASEFGLEVKLQGAYLGNVKITYTTANGAAAEINTSYVYAPAAE